MRRRSVSIKWHVAILGSLVLLPLLIVQGLLLYRIASIEREALGASAITTARSVANGIDRELRAAEAALLSLGTSPHLETGNFEAFWQQARRVADSMHGSIVGLRAPGGKLLAVTALPWGTPLTATIDPVLRRADDQALGSGKLVVTELYTGAVTGNRFVNVQVPIKAGPNQYVLSLAIPPTAIREVIMRQPIDPSWVIGVTDNNGVLIARSHDHERFSGGRSTPEFLANTQGESGRFFGTTLDGVRVLNGYARSALAGWRIGAGIPVATLEAPLRRTYWLLGSVAAAGVLLSVGLGLLYWRYFTGPIGALQTLAAEGGRGGEVRPFKTGISELDGVPAALSDSFSEIARRERDQGLLVRELAHRVKNTLATVQAIAVISLRRGGTLDEFRHGFLQRLHSLARAHDALVERNWSAASLHTLLRNTAEPFSDSSRLRTGSEDIELSTQVAIALGMVFHELFTNATKYGSLSRPEGHVKVDWTHTTVDGAPSLQVTWREEDGPAYVETGHKGFGTQLIDMTVANLGGRIEYAPQPSGFRAIITIPLASLNGAENNK